MDNGNHEQSNGIAKRIIRKYNLNKIVGIMVALNWKSTKRRRNARERRPKRVEERDNCKKRIAIFSFL